MGTLLDGQLAFKKESTFATPVTPDRFPEVLADSTHKPDAMTIQGMGLRVSSVFPRGARRLPGRGKGDLTIKAEVQSKGFGTLFELLAGTSASSNVSGATYQQWHRPILTGTVLPSATIQFGTPRSDSSGTVAAHTYAGCVCKSWELEAVADNPGFLMLTASFWAASYTSATGLASASYVSSPYTFNTVAHTTKIGGTYTVPTSTALTTTSSMTTVTNVRSWKLSVDNGINERPRLGGWQVPTVGARTATLEISHDSDLATYETAYMAQTGTPFFAQMTGGSLSTGSETFELLVPSMFIDDNDFAQLTTGDGPVSSVKYQVMDNLTDAPFYLVQRTSDTTL